MFADDEIQGLRSQLAQIEQDLLEYSEEEHMLVEQLRQQMRNLCGAYGAQAELAVVAVCLEVSIQRAYAQRLESMGESPSSPYN